MKSRVRTERRPKKKPLTPSEARIYDAAQTLLTSSRIAPSAMEIANKAGMSWQYTAKVINALVKKGWLVKEPGKYRSLQLAEAA